MDTGLTREESQELLELLGLDKVHYGNWTLMRKSFLRKCKELHPDKGGDPERASRLITLYKKLEEKITVLNPDSEHSYSTAQVSEVGLGDFFLYVKDLDSCLQEADPTCRCLLCTLRRNHRKRKGEGPPSIWGTCYCYDCYKTWFGQQHSYMMWITWRNIIASLPYKCLNVSIFFLF